VVAGLTAAAVVLPRLAIERFQALKASGGRQ
jgi:hypothetical protein